MQWLALLLAAILSTAVSARELDLTKNFEVAQHSGGGIISWGPLVQPAVVLSGDPTANLLPAPNDAFPNWSVAGLTKIGGIAANEPATQSGSTLTPSGSDDVSQINTAISACSAGQYVLLGSGTFQVSGTTDNHHIWLKKGCVLRGSGPGVTFIQQTPGATLLYQTGSSPPDNCTGCTATWNSPTIWVSPTDLINGSSNTWTGCPWSTACNGSPGTISLAADATQGSSTISVATTSGLSIGMWVRLDEASGATTYTGPLGSSVFAASDMVLNTPSPATGRIAYAGATVENGVAYGALYDRETSEIHLISAIGSGTVTFDSPLTINYRVANHAQIYIPSTAFIQKAGVENMTIENSIDEPIAMMFCAYCWIKNVETKYWIGGVQLTNTARVEIQEVYFHDCADCENNGNEYPVALDGATTEALINNSIFTMAGKGMVGRSCGGGNVVSYNYVDKEFYQAGSIGNFWIDMSVNGSHYTGCHHTLFEGNWGNNLDNDDTHGNEVYHTYFRNWGTGLRTDFVDPSFSTATSVTFDVTKESVSDLSGLGYQNGGTPAYPHAPGNLHAAGTMAEDYWMAWVGNVLGEPGVTCVTGCTQTGWIYQHNGQQTQTVWMLGWVGGGTNDPNLTGSGGATVSCNGTSPPGCSYMFRHANYDVVNAGIGDYQTGYTHTLVNSFYLSGAPSFFGPGASCIYSWPWINPQSGTPVASNSCSGSGLPAKARYDAGTPFVQP